jgi:very-short-patch-repair endonuclease
MTKIYYKPELKELARQLRNRATQSEIKLWKYLRSKQLDGYDFHRQKPIGDYIVDFFCPKLKLAIELDGYTHGLENVFEKDNIKTHGLNEMGIMVLRFTDEDVVKNIDGVLGCIREYIGKHTPDPS